MQPTTTYRPRISRETRLLLTAALLAVAVLWLLARIRFRDRPSPPSPIPAVLSQLTGRPKLDELAAEVAELTTRVRPSVVAIDPASPAQGARRAPRIAGLRWRDDIAVAWLPPTAPRDAPTLISVDPAAGIALFRTPGSRPTAPPVLWAPSPPLGPRYVVATEVVGAEVSLRPAFMPSFETLATPLWPQPLWAVPPGSDLPVGSLVFTSDAEIVGLVIAFAGRRAIVPATTLVAQADRLLAAPPPPPGALGIEVQALTPALASATGSAAGVIVSWVERAGPADARLEVGDVIEAIDGRPVNGRAEWDVAAARLSTGTTMTLRVRRRGTIQDVPVVAAAPSSGTANLGVALRRVRTGAEVLRVEPGSAGERAGLAVSDVITLIGDVAAPTPSQVTRAFATLGQGGRLIVGITRGETHLVTALERER